MKLGMGKNSARGQAFCLVFFFATIISIHLLPPEKGPLMPKDAAPYRQKISQAAEKEKKLPESGKGLGVEDLPRADGGKDRIYYSIVTPEEEAKAQREEKEKVDKSWDMLKNILIDTHAR